MRTTRGSLKAELRSAVKPTEEQLRRFEKFLADKYKRKIPLQWEEDPALKQGFRLQVGADMYDWTLQGRVRQFRDYVRGLESGANDILPLMRQAVEDWTVAVAPEEIGEVTEAISPSTAVTSPISSGFTATVQSSTAWRIRGRMSLDPLSSPRT